MVLSPLVSPPASSVEHSGAEGSDALGSPLRTQCFQDQELLKGGQPERRVEGEGGLVPGESRWHKTKRATYVRAQHGTLH